MSNSMIDLIFKDFRTKRQKRWDNFKTVLFVIIVLAIPIGIGIIIGKYFL